MSLLFKKRVAFLAKARKKKRVRFKAHGKVVSFKVKAKKRKRVSFYSR